MIKMKNQSKLNTYIKMCSKSEAIKMQEAFLFEKVYIPVNKESGIFGTIIENDFVNSVSKIALINEYNKSTQTHLEHFNNFIVIPSSDTLLEMIDTNLISKYVKWTTMDTHFDSNRLIALIKWQEYMNTQKRYSDYAHYLVSFSFSELLLAFIMYNQYQKQWDFNKEEWISI